MKNRKDFTVEEAYTFLPAIRATLQGCKDHELSVRKVFVVYDKNEIMEYNFLIGATQYNSALWSLSDLDEWLGKQKNYHFNPKLKNFVVPVTRIGYSYRNIEVEPISKEDAEDKALNIAGDFEFTERESEYKVVY